MAESINDPKAPLAFATVVGSLIFCLALPRATWQPIYFHVYLALSLGLVVVYALQFVPGLGRIDWFDLVLKGLTLLLLLGCFTTLNLKSYRVDARWTGPLCLQLYVPAAQRDELQLLDSRGGLLAEAALSRDVDGRVLFFWADQRTPARVRLISPGGVVTVLPLGARPSLDGAALAVVMASQPAAPDGAGSAPAAAAEAQEVDVNQQSTSSTSQRRPSAPGALTWAWSR